MRSQALTTVKAGITRLRDKGGASADSLYDLLNGYVTAARTIHSRPGTRIDVVLPPGTKGLVWFQGKFVVFSHQVIDPEDERVEVEVIRHPDVPEMPIRDIHFALPFLGYLYVVAEFADRLVRHYWLEKGEIWQPNHVYLPGTLVRPTKGNGMAYRVESDRAGYEPWAPNVARALGDIVVPTVDNGFRYVVTETVGETPRSGTAEPEWPTNSGETVVEDVSNRKPYGVDSQTQTPNTNVPPAVKDRYGRGSNSDTANSEVR